MAIHITSRLHRNRYGILGFRVVIPRDLRSYFPRHEIRLSLGTSNKTTAKPIAFRLSTVTEHHFLRMRSALTYDEAVAIGKELLQQLDLQRQGNVAESLNQLIPGIGSQHRVLLEQLCEIRGQIESVESRKVEMLQELVSQLEGKDDAEIDRLTCDLYAELTPLVVEGNQRSAAFHQLVTEIQADAHQTWTAQSLEAQDAAHQVELNSLSTFFANVTAHASVKAAETLAARDSSSVTSSLLSEVIAAYCSNQLADGNWTEKTDSENRAILELWLRIVDDKPIKAYGYEQHRAYKSTLQKLPANINKRPQYRGKSIEAILASGDQPAAINTINKNLTRISAFFKWAIEYGYTELNPAQGMTLKNPKRASEERKAFDSDDFSKLFGSHEYLQGEHRQPYMHWTPLIASYTGARLNEIAQLHLADFVQIDGVQSISINDQGQGKRVKTKAARRLIPLHSELIRLGLLEFVDQLRTQGHDRLFPELPCRRDGYGHTVSKWFQRYRQRCGITEAGKVFHSFRHSVIDQLKQAEIPKEKIAALVGHEDESVTTGRYGKNFRIEVLQAVVEQLATQHTRSINSYGR